MRAFDLYWARIQCPVPKRSVRDPSQVLERYMKAANADPYDSRMREAWSEFRKAFATRRLVWLCRADRDDNYCEMFGGWDVYYALLYIIGPQSIHRNDRHWG